MDANLLLESTLLERQLIDAEKFESVKQLITPEKGLADILADQGLVPADIILDILSDYYGTIPINLGEYEPEQDVVEMVPMNVCQKYKIYPLFKIKNTIMIATADPSDVQAMDEIRVKTGFGVEPVLALRSAIEKAIADSYSVEDSVSDVIDTIEDEKVAADSGTTLEEKELIEAASDEPIVKLVNLFISQAVRDKASDIHINPDKDVLRVRYRIDGTLAEVAQPPKKFQAAIISRIKIMSSLDIAERRLPQDGRIEIKVLNRVVALRISTIPTIHGENVVMRILDKGAVLLGLEDLGFGERDLILYNKLIRRPHGILLTSGPTGSGKTTTLYASLNTINSVDKNIMTLEDPVEYDLRLIRQAQVNIKTGFTFAKGLRAILRQDPDIVLVGEIRDLETASIAVQAAMTGHLVFSTLHTNDAAGCIVRLSEMGIPHFLISSTLAAALAQRLVRVICKNCSEEYMPADDAILEVMGAADPTVKYLRGKGCQDCRGSGYKGRFGLYELMEISPRIEEAISRKASDLELKRVAREEGMRSLREDGVEKIRNGVSTIDEVIRATTT